MTPNKSLDASGTSGLVIDNLSVMRLFAAASTQSFGRTTCQAAKIEMKITEGINWILAPTPRFQESLAFFRDVMGLPVMEEGVPVTDTQFSRYAQIKLPNGVVLEIVEPKESVAQLYHAPIVSITVDDVAQARHELEERQVKFVAPVFDTQEGWGWTYFQAPDGTVYQLQGPLQRTTT